MDGVNNCKYYWTLEFFKTRLERMRSLFNYSDFAIMEQNAALFTSSNLAYEHSFLGVAFVYINLESMTRERILSIIDMNGNAICEVRIMVSVIEKTFEVLLLEIEGLNPSLYSSCQVHIETKDLNFKTEVQNIELLNSFENLPSGTFDGQERIAIRVYGAPIIHYITKISETFCTLPISKPSPPQPSIPHELLIKTSVLELSAATGQFQPTAFAKSFSLAHGAQRKLVINISHFSGEELHINSIDGVSIGNPRLPGEESTQGLVALAFDYCADKSKYGESLEIKASWDSSLHDSPLLNKISGSSFLLDLECYFSVTFADFRHKLTLSNTISVVVVKKDTPIYMSLFGKQEITAHTCLKVLHLKKIDYSSQEYVRGQECFGGIEFPGAEIIPAYLDSRQRIMKLEHVQQTRQLLPEIQCRSFTSKGANLLKTCLEIWKMQAAPVFGCRPFSGWTACISDHHLETCKASKSGFVNLYHEEAWIKVWAIVQRPFVLFYNKDKVDLFLVIGLKDTSAQVPTELWQVLEVCFD